MSIEPAPFRRVAIAGVGLIGGSIALAIRRHWRSVRVIAIDRAPVLDSVMRAGAADVGGDTLDVARDADLVVLAAPVMENIALLGQLPGYLEPGAIVTDVGSTKRAVVAAANAIPSLTFVGGHPMSGAAAGGFGAARPDLFDGRPWILTPDARPAATVDRLDAFVTGLGAVPHIMTADLHDRLVGAISHLPQLTASALMHVVGTLAGVLIDRLRRRPVLVTADVASAPPDRAEWADEGTASCVPIGPPALQYYSVAEDCAGGVEGAH